MMKNQFNDIIYSKIFFTDKNNVLLFICDAQDDRQCGRNLLFSKWYHIYGSKAYHKEDLVINVGGTCSYYASFICRKDHPSLKIMQETFIDFQKKIQNKNVLLQIN